MMKNVGSASFFVVFAMFACHASVTECREVTKAVIEQHHKSFLVYIAQQGSDIGKLQWVPSDWAKKKAVKVDKGYDGFSYECIKATFPCFERIKDKNYLKKIIIALLDDSNYIDHIDYIVQRYRCEKPADVNSLFRITHEESIKRAQLPAHINKQELFTSHEKCRQVAHHIKQEDQDVFIIAGLFAKYWIEEAKK